MGKNVLISGASIAGPALAYWLHRYGYEVTVVERAPELRPGGQAVDFRGEVHMTVLRRMGILDEIARHRTDAGRLRVVDAAGDDLVALPASFAGGEVEIQRGDLARILFDLTKDDVEYVFDDSIASLTETAAGVDVTFERAAPRSFDLVVGADGLHSNVRGLVFGEESRFVRESGYRVALFEAPERLGVGPDSMLYSEPGRGLAVFPTRAGRANVMCVYADAGAGADRRDVEAQKRAVAATYADLGWRTEELMADLAGADTFYADSIGMVVMDSWTKGRVALLGDAGYGATCGGMGTGLAIVCAYVLAGELAAADGDHRTAFAAYERAVGKFTKACRQVAGGVGGFFAPMTAGRIKRRTRIYRILTAGPFLRFLNKMTTKAATSITLVDYPVPARL
ncbi:FAD-dependent monooxygenase [Embleya sp. NPDC005575]|uniref:FAD-dependent monooxygenase n=1 Tax=Embleya sp. NPDC005575 TaxID=3156892 RepID=UPI0033BC7479